MKKLKFLSLLKKLTGPELESFHKYLKRHHPREKIALRVFEYLVRFYPNFDEKEKLNVEYIHQKLFKEDAGKGAQSHKKILNTASDLYKWLKDFLIASKIQQSTVLQQTLWLRILQEKGMKAEFSRKASQFYHQTRHEPFSSSDDVMPNWVASYFHREHLSKSNPFIHARVIEQCTDAMTNCWEVLRLRMAFEMILIKGITDQPSKLKIKEPVDVNQIGLPVLINIYQTLLLLIQSGKDVHFTHLEELLNQYGHLLDIKELEGILHYASHATADESRRKQAEEHYGKAHRLNKISAALGVFSKKSILPPSDFGNIVTVACLAQDHPWARAFIRDFSHILPESRRRDTLTIANAVIAFETGNFQETVDLLGPVEFDTPIEILRSKSLLIRSYYELQLDQETIEDTCTSFENFLRRSSPKTAAIKAMLPFVLIMKMLAAKKSSKKVIMDRIARAPDIYSRKWLLEKLKPYKAIHSERKRANR